MRRFGHQGIRQIDLQKVEEARKIIPSNLPDWVEGYLYQKHKDEPFSKPFRAKPTYGK